jgi:hypothetical protein
MICETASTIRKGIKEFLKKGTRHIARVGRDSSFIAYPAFRLFKYCARVLARIQLGEAGLFCQASVLGFDNPDDHRQTD